MNNKCIDLSEYEVILGSQSPRRQELISMMDISYKTVVLPNVDESYPDDIDPYKVAMFIAKKKASLYKSLMKLNSLLIVADTVVVIKDTILGKPQDREDAERMLRMLSGNTHQVITGVVLSTSRREICFQDITNVTFQELTTSDINYYLNQYKPYDKAGAYGIQEWIGLRAISSIEGSFFNVMGLPTDKVYRAIQDIIK